MVPPTNVEPTLPAQPWMIRAINMVARFLAAAIIIWKTKNIKTAATYVHRLPNSSERGARIIGVIAKPYIYINKTWQRGVTGISRNSRYRARRPQSRRRYLNLYTWKSPQWSMPRHSRWLTEWSMSLLPWYLVCEFERRRKGYGESLEGTIPI